MRLIIYVLIILAFFSSCSQDPASKDKSYSSASNDTFTMNPSMNDNATDHASIKTEADNSADSSDISFNITDYDDEPQGDYIGVFYDDNFYGWVSQIRDENEINSYIVQGEYIGESKEKQIIHEGIFDEPIDGADDWEPDSDLECNGLNAGTPLYRIDNYIVAVYDTPVKDGNLVAHKSDGTQEDIGLYVYGHLYRRKTVIEIPSTDTF